MENELVAVTKRLIKFKTVTGNSSETRRAMNYVKRYLSKLHLREYTNGGFESLVFCNKKFSDGDTFDLILHGHIDVVLAENEDQFQPYTREGNLYGRGALDMKGGLAALMVYMRHHLKQTDDKKVALFVTSDEEIGGQNGTEYLMNTMRFKGSFFITAEGEKEYYLKTEQKGVYMFKLIASGKSDHSAYVWKGKNAIMELFNAYGKIENRFKKKKDDRDHWYTTINMGTVHGGLMRSSIPDKAEAECDIRFCGATTNEQAIEDVIKSAIRSKKNISFKKLFSAPQMKTKNTNPYLRNLNATAKKQLNISHDLFFKNHGTNDARFAAKVGIPAVGFGPIGNNYHVRDEYVSIKSLVDFYSILTQI